jgi:hypothetical protein
MMDYCGMEGGRKEGEGWVWGLPREQVKPEFFRRNDFTEGVRGLSSLLRRVLESVPAVSGKGKPR